MFRATLLAGAAVLLFGAAHAQTVYDCVPDEQRVTAPDRLVSVEVTLRSDGEIASVIYRAANGAAYDRAKQYKATNFQVTGKQLWGGTLRANPSVVMVGSLSRQGDRLVYFETIHDKLHSGKVVAHVRSICEPTLAEAPPLKVPVPRSPSVPIAVSPAPPAQTPSLLTAEQVKAEMAATNKKIDPFQKRWTGCTVREASGLAIAPGDTQDIVTAALAACTAEYSALIVAVIEALPDLPIKHFEDEVSEVARRHLTLQVVRIRAALAGSHGPAAPVEPKRPKSDTPI
jgi:hypothetical protein